MVDELCGGGDFDNFEFVSIVVMPELIGSYAVKGRELACLQEEVDRGHDAAAAVMLWCEVALGYGELSPIDLCIGSALDMRCEGELVYPILG